MRAIKTSDLLDLRVKQEQELLLKQKVSHLEQHLAKTDKTFKPKTKVDRA